MEFKKKYFHLFWSRTFTFIWRALFSANLFFGKTCKTFLISMPQCEQFNCWDRPHNHSVIREVTKLIESNKYTICPGLYMFWPLDQWGKRDQKIFFCFLLGFFHRERWQSSWYLCKFSQCWHFYLKYVLIEM